jgi:hypothetical protein
LRGKRAQGAENPASHQRNHSTYFEAVSWLDAESAAWQNSRIVNVLDNAMTTIGEILNEFFSPLSSEKMWVMPEDDDYTKLVRKWKPVIESVDRAKLNLNTSCSNWQSQYASRPTWKPTMTDTPKSGAFRDFVPSPPGTDPGTCKEAFIIYAGSVVAKDVILGVPGILLPSIQTNNLYTCSIGSFNVYTTIDAIDCSAKTATMNFWMYNSMSKRSFGRFADNPVFVACGMKTQFMWWNWVEYVDWSSGTVKTLPKTTSGGGW